MKMPSAKLMNIALVLLYSLAGMVFPLILPEQSEAYAICALANLPLVTAWMGFIWAGKRDEMKFQNDNSEHTVQASSGGIKAKTICNIMIVAFSFVGIGIAIFLPDNAQMYGASMIATDPFVIAWMGFIWGGNRAKLEFSHQDVVNAIGEAKRFIQGEELIPNPEGGDNGV